LLDDAIGWVYSSTVAEKNATGFGSPNTHGGQTAELAVFFRPYHCVSYERRWWGGFGLPVPCVPVFQPCHLPLTPRGGINAGPPSVDGD
jgi:hypothetical protein